MSDGHWETVRGSHREAEGNSDSESVAPATGTAAGAAAAGVRERSEVLVGWRVWRLSTPTLANPRPVMSGRLTLVSTFMTCSWEPGKPMRACCGTNIVRHGIHAFTTRAQAEQYMHECRKPLRYVFGEVSLWGRVVIHEHGYRAAYAYPKQIFVPHAYRGDRDVVNELRRTYGVEADWVL